MTSTASSHARATPYQGLRNYAEEDTDFFFGREPETDALIASLKAQRLTIVFGESGVGKSSLLRAGVAARVRAQARERFRMIDTPEFVPVVVADWRSDPVARLTAAISESIEEFQSHASEAAGDSLAATIQAAGERIDGYLLIILDQFEDYFRYHDGDAGDERFRSELTHALSQNGLPASFLISIREDAVAELDRLAIPRLFDIRIRIGHLDQNSARQAIEAPLKPFNELPDTEQPVAIETELVEAVLAQSCPTRELLRGDAGRNEPPIGDAGRRRTTGRWAEIEAPYLQLVMSRLWTAEQERGSHTLRLETLTELGGAREIVRTHLDETLRALSPAQSETAIAIFHYLVTPSGTKIAHSAEDLAGYSRLPKERVEAVLELLAGGQVRLVRRVPPPSGEDGAPRYEIYHDLLSAAIIDWRRRRETERLARKLQSTRRRQRLAVAGVILLLVAAGIALAAGITRSTPTPISIAPVSGAPAGGTFVTIRGSDLNHVTRVMFGAVAATGLDHVSNTQLEAFSPPGRGSVRVLVDTPAGRARLSTAPRFTYEGRPVVSELLPPVGSPGGGTPVTIHGSNLAGAALVTFNGTAGGNLHPIKDGLRVRTPPGTGKVQAVVNTPSGSSKPVAAATFRYEDRPVVTAVSPAAGSPVTGGQIEITGLNFTDVTAVMFGRVPGRDIIQLSGTELLVFPPAEQRPGTAPVVVRTPVGSSNRLEAGFTFEYPPVVRELSPAAGTVAGGTTVTISGSNFVDATGVTFGGVPGTDLGDINGELEVETPAGATGTVPVVVTTPAGSSALGRRARFTYEAPVVGSVSPNNGPATGGTTVTIDGTNLQGATAVSFGAAAATNLSVAGDGDVITVLAPPGTAGTTVPVRITTPAGRSSARGAPTYSYGAPAGPTITAISPSSGPRLGGMTVEISGINLEGATEVKFGRIAATIIDFSFSAILVVAPPGTAGTTVPVTVTTPAGISAATARSSYTYVPLIAATG